MDKAKAVLRSRRWQIKNLSRRRHEWLNSNGPCVKCGSNNNLEIDHIDRTKKMLSINNIWSRKREIRENELLKCQVLCYSCHKEKTAKERRDALVHGQSHYLYLKYKCRCKLCCELHAKWWQNCLWKQKLRRCRIMR